MWILKRQHVAVFINFKFCSFKQMILFRPLANLISIFCKTRCSLTKVVSIFWAKVVFYFIFFYFKLPKCLLDKIRRRFQKNLHHWFKFSMTSPDLKKSSIYGIFKNNVFGMRWGTSSYRNFSPYWYKVYLLNHFGLFEFFYSLNTVWDNLSSFGQKSKLLQVVAEFQ